MSENENWIYFKQVYHKYAKVTNHHSFCLGVKVDLSLKDLILNIIDYIKKSNAKIVSYDIEFYGRLAGLKWSQELIQSMWDNYGLVGQELWSIYKNRIFEELEKSYKGNIDN